MNQDILYNFVKQLNSEFIGPILVFVLLGAGLFFYVPSEVYPALLSACVA